MLKGYWRAGVKKGFVCRKELLCCTSPKRDKKEAQIRWAGLAGGHSRRQDCAPHQRQHLLNRGSGVAKGRVPAICGSKIVACFVSVVWQKNRMLGARYRTHKRDVSVVMLPRELLPESELFDARRKESLRDWMPKSQRFHGRKAAASQGTETTSWSPEEHGKGIWGKF